MLENIRSKLKWLDPFTYVDIVIIPKVKALNKKMQLIVFLATYIILLGLVAIVFGFTPVLAGSVTLLYIYLFFFEKDEALVLSIYVVSAFVFAYVLYYFVLSLLLGTSSPLVIVFSGSMQPILYRGDVVILGSPNNIEMNEVVVDFPIGEKLVSEYAEIGSKMENGSYRNASLKINGQEYEFDPNGPIVVYYSSLQNRDIIHRAVLRIRSPDGDFFITFGDNNARIDQDCGGNANPVSCINKSAVSEKNLTGKYLFHIPFLGQAKLFFFDDLPKLLAG